MIIKDSIIYFLIRATSGILGLVSLIVFTNLLSTKDYGIYSLALSLGSSFSAIFFGWLSISYARLHEEQTENIEISIVILYFKAITIMIALSPLFFLFEEITNNQDTPFITLINIALIAVLLGYHSISLQKFNSNFKKKITTT